ncbi:MAG: hypothetical protein FWE21_06205 [Defluviitaleaceae bacterium]|nr:hypothetical protein [Defluviitaleaceae bacterium]
MSFYTFNLDGSGFMPEDIPIRWSTNNGVLYLCLTPDSILCAGTCLYPLRYSYSISDLNQD